MWPVVIHLLGGAGGARAIFWIQRSFHSLKGFEFDCPGLALSLPGSLNGAPGSETVFCLRTSHPAFLASFKFLRILHDHPIIIYFQKWPMINTVVIHKKKQEVSFCKFMHEILHSRWVQLNVKVQWALANLVGLFRVTLWIFQIWNPFG